MTVELKLHLPEKLVEYAKLLGYSTQRDIETVLTDTLEMLLPTLENLTENQFYANLPNLSDAEILTLANSKMDTIQNERLGKLQTQGKNIGLTELEQYELSQLIQIYQIGQLKKSVALAEAVKRGLKKPLLP
ncbi:MAG TPA: hypothetical protein V6C58_15935 [Allocoleopsis sp.]